jgi:hypothetical protein
MNVWSDASAAVTLRTRAGEARSAAKSFTISPTLASTFFADLKAAKDGNAASVHCMKSASFGTSTHIEWHGWTSPDLDCPPGDKLMQALIRDVNAIRAAGNVQTVPYDRLPSGPPRLLNATPIPEASTAPTPT